MTGADDRPRGILSPADRAFLRGTADLESEQSAYDARYRIRERVKNAVLDFRLLFEHLEPRDREQVFDPPGAEREDFAEGVIAAVGFLYLATGEFDPPRENLFREAIRRAESRERPDRLVRAHFAVEGVNPDHLDAVIDRVESGQFHDLTDADLRAFAHLCGTDCDRPPRAVLAERRRRRGDADASRNRSGGDENGVGDSEDGSNGDGNGDGRENGE